MLTTWRPHTLDGALLWFQPATGLSVRVDGPETRALRRRAPRLVLFGITNKCNLACGFCSRDQAAASAWTADSAHDVLAGLAQRGRKIQQILESPVGGHHDQFAVEHGIANIELVQPLGQQGKLVACAQFNGHACSRTM